MKKILTMAIVMTSAIFFLFGFWSGQNINGFVNQVVNSASAKGGSSFQELPNHQQNILIVSVDNLSDSSPKLVSVWLMLYIKNTPKITWMPLYLETSNQNESSFVSTDIPLDEQFHLENKKLNGEFENALRRKDIWWNGYVITDEQGVAALMEILKSSPMASNKDPENVIIDSQPVTLLSLSAVTHVNTIKKICRLASTSEYNDELKNWIGDGNHVSTDIPVEEFIAQWKGLFNNGENLTCEFPSLLAIQ